MKHSLQNIALTLAVTLILTLSGCGSGGTVITGTVKYPDGSPVKVGSVSFDNGRISFVGLIQEDGSYTTGLSGERKIPPGTYRVSLQGTTFTEYPASTSDNDPPEVSRTRIIRHVADKYTSPDTSGLTLEVQTGGRQTFDLTVEKP